MIQIVRVLFFSASVKDPKNKICGISRLHAHYFVQNLQEKPQLFVGSVAAKHGPRVYTESVCSFPVFSM